MDECTITLESMLGKCADHHLKEDYIIVWDAISFLQSGLDLAGKNLADLQAMKITHDNSLSDKLKALEDSVQSTFSKISQSFQELVTFTKVLSDEQAMASQQFKSSLNADGSLTELRRDVQMLSAKISTMETSHLYCTPPTSHAAEEINAWKLQVKLLESRIPIYNLLRLGGMAFQSRSEGAVFAENKMPSNSLSVF